MLSKTKKDLRTEILDYRTQIRKLYSQIDFLLEENRKLNVKNRSGSIVMDVEDVLNDIHFMYRVGETKIRLVYRDGEYKRMEGLDDHVDILPL